jgi:pimeloyl-ACP methyl ester carboxylesterase
VVALILVSTLGLGALAVGGLALLGLYPWLPRDLGGVPDLDVRARKIRIPVGAHDALDGWWLRGAGRAVVLVFHGFGRDHTRAWRYGAFLHRAGYDVVTIDFRSSRQKGRKPTTLGHYEIEDARATLAWIEACPEFAGLEVAVFGESLGGSVALLTAAEHPRVSAVIADCAFANGRLALEESCERWARLPRRPTADLLVSMLRTVTGRDPTAIDVVAAAERLGERPVLFIHGTADDRLSPDQARALWRAAGSKDPLWIIERSGHNQGWVRHRALYEERVTAFLDRHLLGRGPGLPAGSLW